MAEKNPYSHKHYTHVKDEKEADGVAWAFLNKEEFAKFPFKFADELGEEELRANVIYTGLCQSDSHTGRGRWGPAPWPIATGHEIVAIVSQVGKNVKNFKVGDRVAYGPTRLSCDECRECKSGSDNLCQGIYPDAKNMFGEYWGGYSTAIQEPAMWGFKVPESLPSDKVPPLLCAGVTVHAPLDRWARPMDRVAVIGIGGLGHLAVMYANKFGCKVTAFSSHPDKKDLIEKLGAHEVVSSTDKSVLDKHKNSYDLIINTLSVSDEETWTKYLAMTAPNGTFVQVGAPPVDQFFKFQAFEIVAKNVRIAGSVIGSRKETNAMLEFSARHNILPMCEFFSFDDFPKALDTLENGKPKFRCVVNVEEWSKKHGFFKQ